ncbi:MAG: hypothetical protein IPK68_22355 [Bdellovibrionales bacterium]|nr:hypothetical protein [Bdellovibrionales bacterium]
MANRLALWALALSNIFCLGTSVQARPLFSDEVSDELAHQLELLSSGDLVRVLGRGGKLLEVTVSDRGLFFRYLSQGRSCLGQFSWQTPGGAQVIGDQDCKSREDTKGDFQILAEGQSRDPRVEINNELRDFAAVVQLVKNSRLLEPGPGRILGVARIGQEWEARYSPPPPASMICQVRVVRSGTFESGFAVHGKANCTK